MGGTQAKLLLIGLDNSGKTTILSRIMDPNYLDTNITPTIGFKKQKFSRNNINFQVLDMSGQSKYRDLWKSNATNTSAQDRISGIIFVIDSSNKMRINVARSQLQIILQIQQISKSIPFLFYANKCDLKQSISIEQIQQIMGLKQINRKYQIIQCSGITGKGVEIGIEWLSMEVKKIIQNIRMM